MADLPDPIMIGNPNGYCFTNGGCGVQTMAPNELPLGKIKVSYRVLYKYFSRNKPLPYGYVELNIPTYRGGTINGSWGVSVEILNVSNITPAYFDDDKNFEDAWKYSQSQLPIQDREDWQGSFSAIKSKLVAAYNDNSSAEYIKNALIADQTPLIYTREFANEHAKLTCLEACPLGQSYEYRATLTSTLNVSCSPGLAQYTRYLGTGKGQAADRILIRMGERREEGILVGEGPPTLKELAVFCDTYAFVDNGIGRLRIFPNLPVKESLINEINAKFSPSTPAHNNLFNYTPENLVDIRNQVPILAGGLSKTSMDCLLSTLQGGRGGGGGGGGGFSFRSKALYVGGQVGNIGETAIFAETRVPYLNNDATRFDIAIGVTLSLGTGADGRPLVEAVRIAIESRHITIQKGAQVAMRLSVQIVEKIGQLLFSKNKTTAVKAAEAKAAVDAAVANGTITKQQGDQTKALVDDLKTKIENGGNNTPSQVITNALVGTNAAYRPISDYNGLSLGGLPGTNTGGAIVQGNGQLVPTQNGGIVNDVAVGLNNAQTNLIAGINPGPQTGGSLTNNPVPDSLELVNTNNPPASQVPSNGAQNILTNSFVGAGVAGTGGTVTIRDPNAGTSTNVVVGPGQFVSDATNNSPHVPQPENNQPNLFGPTPVQGYTPPNLVYVTVTGPNTSKTPTWGVTDEVDTPETTTDGKKITPPSKGNGGVGPGYGIGGFLENLPSIFAPMPNINLGSSSTSTEPGTTNPGLLDWLNSLPQAPDGLTLVPE